MSTGASRTVVRVPAVAASAHAGRIGPNAITQSMAVMAATLGDAAMRALMHHAGLQRHLDAPPTQMIDERDVQALHHALRADLGVTRARAIGREAGLRTGDYLLANRIPRPMRWLLPKLPAALAAQVLVAAIAAHAWTFCGSAPFGRLPAGPAARMRLSIGGCATCREELAGEPLGDYFAATFERLFTALVHPRATVEEVACVALGGTACVFALRWP